MVSGNILLSSAPYMQAMQKNTKGKLINFLKAVSLMKHEFLSWSSLLLNSGVPQVFVFTVLDGETDLHHQTATRRQWFLCPVSS